MNMSLVGDGYLHIVESDQRRGQRKKSDLSESILSRRVFRTVCCVEAEISQRAQRGKIHNVTDMNTLESPSRCPCT